MEAKRKLTSDIQEVDALEDRQELAPELFDKREELKNTLGKVLDDEEILWKTRAK